MVRAMTGGPESEIRTIGIGDEWDPGDPPEIHDERKKERRHIMATRTRGIALGRIIDWFKNCDPEEGKFAIHRAANILQERTARVENADAAGKVKRTRRKKGLAP